MTDEQLARKLQAEWDQDIASNGITNQTPETSGVRGPSSSPDKTGFQLDEGDLNSENRPAYESAALNSKPQVLREGPKSKTTLSLQAAGSNEDTITSNIPFDESPLTFEPAKYVASLQGLWAAEGGSASYALLTRCFVLVNSTQSRIKIVDTLVNLLRVIIEGDPSSLLPTVRIIYYFLPNTRNLYLLYTRYEAKTPQPLRPLLCINTFTGLARYQFHLAAIHISGTWTWRIRNFQSPKDSMRARQQVFESPLRQGRRRRRCCF